MTCQALIDVPIISAGCQWNIDKRLARHMVWIHDRHFGGVMFYVPYSLNFSRVKIFADFEVLSQTVKILASKYLSKHTFSLRNGLNPRKFYPRIRKSGSAFSVLGDIRSMLWYRLYKRIFTPYCFMCIVPGIVRERRYQ